MMSLAKLKEKARSWVSWVLHRKAPLIVNYGMGVDSTAVLVALWLLGIRPDLIIFADVGDEKPETYAYLPTINAWLRKVGFPEVTVVRYKPADADYHTLSEKCLALETLPSMAFNKHSCSLFFKAEVIDRFLLGVKGGPNPVDPWLPAEHRPRKEKILVNGKRPKTGKRIKVIPAAEEMKPIKLIGYDAGDADTKRSFKATTDDGIFRYEFPLQVWGWTREECIKQIEAVGLPAPVKSACFMCPSSKKWEIYWLAAKHPELFLRAIRIEDNARDGKHGLKEKRGLGISYRWRNWAEKEGFLVGNKLTLSSEELLAKAAADKPAHEANDCSVCPAFAPAPVAKTTQLPLFAA